ncbi:uncharacterized protein ACA1_072130 [Acanthamoeba castellanii str. Neff]|uniref:Uncharacterized protein n=1 Tax=Acanthamoeba castellanii (strain ATCC 30010 / Neff) TaxID=1257118 RepID=L8HGQ5_ACACF|nr:uncharacterized protein ACA1_072130 [Acanthamoeba castellanii str. Neff]ELR23591.1 hypothetical protein ACA1_072130 [Acanthamoeba castellanii str. Neff]
MQKSSNQRGDANFELQRVFASAWNKRLTPAQWGRAIKDHFGPRAATSPLLCDFLLQQARVGPSPSPLLLSYIRHSLSVGLVAKAHFFNSLCDVASPAAPGQFSAFLQLVAEFAPLMISHEEREELRRSIAKEQQSRHKRKRALSKSYDDEGMMDLEGSSQGTEPHQAEQGGDHSKKARTAAAAAAELEFGEEQMKEGGSTTTDGISFIARIFLRLAEMLVSAVAYLSSSSAGQGGSCNNLEVSVNTLVALLTHHKCLAFLLLARHEHPDLWSSFCSKCEDLFKSGSGELVNQATSTSLTPHPHKHILKPLWRALQGLLSTEWCRLYCRGWLKHNLFTNVARHNSNAYNRPWIAIALVVKEESPRVCGEDAEPKGLPRARMLWSAALRFYNSKRTAVHSREWYIARNYLLVKVPLLMQQWTDMNETEQTFAQIPQLSHFNPVELSLIHLSHFPTLVSPGVTTGTKARSSSVSSPPLTPTQALVSPSSSTLSTSHPVLTGASPAAASADALSNAAHSIMLGELASACLHRGLVSRDKLETFLPGLTIDGVSTDLYSVEAMLAGTPPQKKEDVDQLFGFLRNKELGEDVVKKALEVVGNLHQHLQAQEHLVQAVLSASDPFASPMAVKEEEGPIAPATLAQLFATLCSDYVLDALFLHATLPQLASNVAVHCARWGDGVLTQVEEISPETRSEAASLFPSAFTLLVAILEKLEVKSCASNQEAFQRTDGFMYLLSEEKRQRGELKEEPSGSHGSPDGSKEKHDKASLLTWYNSYMFSKFDLSTPAKAQLYLGCVHKKFSLAACCAHYKTALDVIPFIHIPLYLWLATELLVTIQHTTISTGGSPPSYQVSVPLLVLSTLAEQHPLSAKARSKHRASAPPPKSGAVMVTAIGVSLKKALETAGDNPQSEKLKTMLQSVVTTKYTHTTPLNAQLQKDFLAALPETMPSTSFTHFSFILSRVGKREFCDHMFRCIIHSLHGGMGSRHALRAAEMSACLVALCGGKDLVATLFSQYLPLCHFGQKTQFYGQLVAYMSVLSAALTGMHLVPLSPPGQAKPPVELALLGVFDYITTQLELMVEHPSSTLAFTLTFLSLATAIPSIFRFAPALRLATALAKLGAYQLLFCIFFTPASPSKTAMMAMASGEDELLPIASSDSAAISSSRRMLDVAKAVIAHKAFGDAKELLFE